MIQQITIVGRGALAEALLRELPRVAADLGFGPLSVAPWDGRPRGSSEPASPGTLVVHAGSGRQLAGVVSYCQDSKCPLLQASTGVEIDHVLPSTLAFPLVEAPNLSMPIVKLIHLLRNSGHLFANYQVSIVESHQKEKRSLPGTAMEFAKALGLDAQAVVSVRDPAVQTATLGIRAERLARHAVHLIRIGDGDCEISLRTEIHGFASYVRGVLVIAGKIRSLAPGRYHVADLVKAGLL